MNKLHVLLLGLFIGCSYSKRVKRLVDGSIIERGQFPFFAQLIITDISNTVFPCSGSLIHPQWLLTAADCFPNSKAERQRIENLDLDNVFTVCMGSDSFNDFFAFLNSIKKIYIHPGFQKRSVGTVLYIKSNIAVVKLKRPYNLNKFVDTISLPSQKNSNKRCSVGEVISVGPTSSDEGTRNRYVRHLQLIVSESIPGIEKTSDTIFYGKAKNKSGHTLQGKILSDSGAPFVCFPDQTVYEEGIQYGVVAGSEHRGSTITYIENIERYMGFIRRYVPNLKEYKNSKINNLKKHSRTFTSIKRQNFTKKNFRKMQMLYEGKVEAKSNRNYPFEFILVFFYLLVF